MLRRSPTLVVLAVCGASALGGVARADTQRVALGPVVVLGDSVTPALRAQLRTSLLGGLAAGGFDLVSDEEVERKLQSAPGLAACQTPTCMQRLGTLLGVPRVVTVRVELQGMSNYIMSLDLIATAGATKVGHVEDTCQVCTGLEANESLSNAARQLVTQAIGPRPVAPEGVVVRTAAEPRAADKPLHRRWQLWLGVGLGAAAIIAVGVGVGVGVGSSGGTDFWQAGRAGCPGCPEVDLR